MLPEDAAYIASSALLVLFCIAYPIVALTQCWTVHAPDKKKRAGWTTFILLTWPFLALGAVAYGMATYSKGWKFAPAGILAGLILLTFMLASDKDAARPYIVVSSMLESRIEKEISDPQLAGSLRADLAVMKNEVITDHSRMQRNLALVQFLHDEMRDGLTQEEMSAWRRLYSSRRNLSADNIDLYQKRNP